MADGLLDSGGDACQDLTDTLQIQGNLWEDWQYRAPESVEMKKKGDFKCRKQKKVVCLLGAVMLAAG